MAERLALFRWAAHAVRAGSAVSSSLNRAIASYSTTGERSTSSSSFGIDTNSSRKQRGATNVALLHPPPAAVRAIHTSTPAQSGLVIGGLSVAAAALAASYAVRAYNAANPPEEGAEKPTGTLGGTNADGSAKKEEAKPTTSHKGFGAEMLARRFYRGPFEDKMTRREAALILGVRESAAVERIRERHKKMLIANHPDLGGSTFVAGKINEAKDLLLGKTKP